MINPEDEIIEFPISREKSEITSRALIGGSSKVSIKNEASSIVSKNCDVLTENNELEELNLGRIDDCSFDLVADSKSTGPKTAVYEIRDGGTPYDSLGFDGDFSQSQNNQKPDDVISCDSEGFVNFDEDHAKEDAIPSKYDKLRYARPSICGTTVDLHCWVCKEPMSQGEVYCDCQEFEHNISHKHCLIEWMNSLCKGRCPKCRYKYRVKTEQKPRTAWALDPILRQGKKRYITMMALNFIIILVGAVVLAQVVMHMQDNREARVAIACILGVLFVIYMFYQTRVYHRLYERTKIYNNKVIDVFERGREDRGTARKDLSSYFIRDITM